METFQDILCEARPKKVIVSPRPGAALQEVFERAGQAGYTLTVKQEFSAQAFKEILEGYEREEWDILVQGALPLADFFAVLEEAGVGKNRLGFVSLFEDRIRHKLLFVVDTYVHNVPSFREKVMLLEMTIELANLLGVERPRAAVLSALETVNPAIFSSIEAAALSKMTDRGQFKACVEGPLDIDSALSAVAARRKGVSSPVPGEVDILLCPDIESSYALSLFLSGLGRLPVAGVLLGTPLPVIIHPALIPPQNKQVEIAIASLRDDRKAHS